MKGGVSFTVLLFPSRGRFGGREKKPAHVGKEMERRGGGPFGVLFSLQAFLNNFIAHRARACPSANVAIRTVRFHSTFALKI